MNEPAAPADQRIAYGDHPSQFVDFRYPSGQASGLLAIYIHGGFWRARIDLSHGGHPCAAIAAAGHLSASIEYRRAGEEGGGWPGTIEDVRRAVRFVREQHPGMPTVVLGHSAGGHLALCMAGEIPDLRKVIALGPVAHPRRVWELNLGDGAAVEFFGGGADEFPERYAMGRPLCPTVLIHGTLDEVVPIEVSRMYEGGRLMEIEGGDHFDVIDPETPTFAKVLAEIAA
jgi:acetyl esterase/lipase